MIEIKLTPTQFQAILEMKQPFILRHEPIEENEIIVLVEKITNTYLKNRKRTITFIAGCPEPLKVVDKGTFETKMYRFACDKAWDIYDHIFDWYRSYNWKFIKEKKTYLIPIKELQSVSL